MQQLGSTVQSCGKYTPLPSAQNQGRDILKLFYSNKCYKIETGTTTLGVFLSESTDSKSRNGSKRLEAHFSTGGVDTQKINKEPHSVGASYFAPWSDSVTTGMTIGKTILNESNSTTDNELAFAVFNSDVKSVTQCIHLYDLYGLGINRFIMNGFTALHIAAAEGHLEIVKLLIAKGAEINKFSNNGLTALHFASANGYIDTAQLLLRNGAEINKRTEDGFTALHIAACCGQVDIMCFLSSQGARIGQITKCLLPKSNLAVCQGHAALEAMKVEAEGRGKNPQFANIHSAASNGCVNSVNALIKAGADVNELLDDVSALFLAACQNHLNVVALLIQNGANTKQCNKKGLYPLHIAAARNSVATVKYLIERNVFNVDFETHDGQTALILAARWGYTELVAFLIKCGADIYHRTKEGESALSLAAERNHVEIIKLLHKKGVNLSQYNNNGISLLHLAALKGCLQTVRFLIEEVQVNVDVLCTRRRTPLSYAAFQEHIDTVIFLLDCGANVNHTAGNNSSALYIATNAGNTDLVECLLKRGADINLQSKDGYTALMMTCIKGDEDTLRLLIKRGADVNITGRQNNLNALHLAASHGQLSVIKILTDITLVGQQNLIRQLSTITDSGCSVMHTAAAFGSIEVVKYLSKFMSIDHENLAGLLASHLAAGGGHLEVLKLLLRWGIDVKARSNSGMTVLHLAVGNGHTRVINFLIENCYFTVDDLTNGANCYAPYRLAVCNGQTKVLEHLHKNFDVDINLHTVDQISSILLAAQKGQEEVLKLIVSTIRQNDVKECCLTARDVGRLKIFEARDQEKIIMLLKKYGINVPLLSEQSYSRFSRVI